MFKRKKYRYEIHWGCCDGRENRYTANTVEEIRKKVDKDNTLSDVEKRILKYGYDRVFEKDIKTDHICIDNAFCVYWYKYQLIY